MTISRVIYLAVSLSLSASVMAQNALTEDGTKAQKALVENLRERGITPTVDTKDNSVCFKRDNVFYWVTFDENTPVLYTIHRKGLKFDDDPAFKSACAILACNEVNRMNKVKCIFKDKRVEFILQTYAKNPSDFHGGFTKMLAAFKDVDVKFKNTYDKAYDQWKKDSIAENQPIVPDTPFGKSTLNVTYITFGNFDAKGNVISDYDQPLRKSSIKYIKASLDVSSTEKGIFKLGMKITNPDGKAMVATKNMDYCSTANLEIKKIGKAQVCEFSQFGSDSTDFWKAGEYKVEIFDFENGTKLYSTTFNVL